MMELTSLISKENLLVKAELANLMQRATAQHQHALKVVQSGNKADALAIINTEQAIFAEYVNIEADIAFNIAKAPVDKNLRRTIAYFAISRETSHIARYANQVAKFVLILEAKPASSSVRRIVALQKMIINALQECKSVILEENHKAALKLAKKDAAIDELTTSTRVELVTSLAATKTSAEVDERMFVNNIINSLERVGDTIVRICEYIIYIETGNHTRL